MNKWRKVASEKHAVKGRKWVTCDRREFLEIIETASRLTTPSRRDADLNGLYRLRRNMADALLSYERFVSEEVCDKSMWTDPGEVKLDAWTPKALCNQVCRDYETFVNRWSLNGNLGIGLATEIMADMGDAAGAMDMLADARKTWSDDDGLRKLALDIATKYLEGVPTNADL